MKWNQKLRDLRRRRGLTLAEVAKALGVDESSVGHWEKGRRSPLLAHLRKLAVVLDVPFEELVADNPAFVANRLEQRVLDALRRLPEDQQQTALRLLESLAPDAD